MSNKYRAISEPPREWRIRLGSGVKFNNEDLARFEEQGIRVEYVEYDDKTSLLVFHLDGQLDCAVISRAVTATLRAVSRRHNITIRYTDLMGEETTIAPDRYLKRPQS